MNAVTDFSAPARAMRALAGPGLLLLAPLQFALGDALLDAHPLLERIDIPGGFGLVLVMTASLLLIAGLGETINWLTERFRTPRRRAD